MEGGGNIFTCTTSAGFLHPRGGVTVRRDYARLCPQSSFMHGSCKITPIRRGFQNTICACLFGNESIRMAVFKHNFFYVVIIPFIIKCVKPWSQLAHSCWS